MIHEYEGVVLEVKKDTFFFARLVDLTCKSVDQETEILIDEVFDEDKEFIVPGAIFNWHTSSFAPIIRFRQLPIWREEEMQEAQRKAEQLQESLGWREGTK